MRLLRLERLNTGMGVFWSIADVITVWMGKLLLSVFSDGFVSVFELLIASKAAHCTGCNAKTWGSVNLLSNDILLLSELLSDINLLSIVLVKAGYMSSYWCSWWIDKERNKKFSQYVIYYIYYGGKTCLNYSKY